MMYELNASKLEDHSNLLGAVQYNLGKDGPLFYKQIHYSRIGGFLRRVNRITLETRQNGMSQNASAVPM